MTAGSFDFAPLLPPGLPPAAAKWAGLPKYNFTGGNNDADQVPVDDLIAAATAVLKREGQTLATYGLASGPQGYRAAARFPGRQAQARRRHLLHGRRDPGHLRLAAGDRSRQRRAAHARRHRAGRAGVLPGLAQPADAARRQGGRHPARQRRHADGRAGERARRPQAPGIQPKYIYTIPTVQNPTGTIMPEARRLEMLRLAAEYGVPIFEDDCYADLIWDGERPPALYAMSQNGDVIHIGSFSKSIAPALRVGYIVAPWGMLSRMLAIKTDAGSGALEQMVLAEYCAPHFAEHVPRSDPRPAGEARHPDGVRSTSSSAPAPSSRSRRAASSCGSSCPTTSTRRSSTRPRWRPASRSIRGPNGRPTRATAGAGCGSASRARPRTRSGRASRVLAEVCRREFGVPTRIANVAQRAPGLTRISTRTARAGSLPGASVTARTSARSPAYPRLCTTAVTGAAQ